MNIKVIAIIIIIALIGSFTFWRYQSVSQDVDVVVEENLENNELENMINQKQKK